MSSIPAPRLPLQERGSAVIGKGVTIKGQIFSREDLTIDGEVDGTVELQDVDTSAIGSSPPKGSQSIETQSDHFNRSAVISSFPKNPRRRWSRKSHDNTPTKAGGRN